MHHETPTLARYDHFIAGRPHPPARGEYFPSDDPYTTQPWAEVARGDATDVDAAVAAARTAFGGGDWPLLTASQRGRLLCRLGDAVEREADALAAIEQRDNGKLLAEVRSQVRYLADYYRYYGGLADKIQGGVVPSDKKGVFAHTRYEAKGVVAIITPWNSPLTLASWKLAPALAAGCTAVVKPSEHASASMVEFARLVAATGFPAGVVNVVTGYGDEVGAALVAHPGVAHVGFTGGVETGRRIYELAARHLKTVTLELGGKSPNIVFDDADLEQAVRGAIAGIFTASGQSCQAGSRLLVQRSIHDRLVARLLEAVRDLRLGDPRDPATQVGPIATRRQFDKVIEYIAIARAEGATCVAGGRSRPQPGPFGGGRFVEPTVFTGVRNAMRIAQEEVFGPVLAVIPFDDEADAIRIANDVAYGLVAGVWTRDLRRAMLMSDKLQAGTVWVNNYRATSFTAPFGGVKASGIGRESGSEAIKEYLNTKCVWISAEPGMPDPFHVG